MGNEKLPIVIVGGGHSGCDKAKELMNLGEEHFIVFEMTPFLGGLYAYKYDRKEYFSCLSDPRFHINSIVQAISPTLELLVESEEDVYRIQARKIYLCAGSYEEPIPFPGWTLPGVITKQAAELLYYRDNANLGENIVYIKDQLVEHDGLLSELKASENVHIIDFNEVESFVCQGKSGQINRAFQKVNGKENKLEDIDVVICCNRKVPNIDLIEMIGAKTFINKSGPPIPLLTTIGETSIPNLFVCGSATGSEYR